MPLQHTFRLGEERSFPCKIKAGSQATQSPATTADNKLQKEL